MSVNEFVDIVIIHNGRWIYNL